MTEVTIKQFEDIPESYQEYVETIFRLNLKNKEGENVSNIQIANYMNIKPSSVTNMLKKLADKKLIRWKPRTKNIKLTALGNRIGKKIIINHVVMELFLSYALGIEDQKVRHELACELEHHMKGPIFEAFTKVFGKKAIKEIEHQIDEKVDPEEVNLEGIMLFPNPESVIKSFIEFVSIKNPDLKSLLEKEQDKFLEDIS